MNKDYQKQFYEVLGAKLTERMKKKNLTVSALARGSGEQYNTIKYALEGRPFQFHQALWIIDCLRFNLDDLLDSIRHTLMAGAFDGKEEKENGKQEENQGIQGLI